MFYTYFRLLVAHYSQCEIHKGVYAQRMIYSKSSALEKSIHCSSSALAAPHRGCEWLRAGCRAAAGGGSSHGPERFRWMAASSCCSVLGSGKVDITGSRKQIRQREQRVFFFFLFKPLMSFTTDVVVVFQMHVAELLVSHGASLNAKTFLEETPIGIFTPQHSLINTPGGRWRKLMSYLSTVSFQACSVDSFASWVHCS